MNPTVICPTLDRLKQFVSGELPELEADALIGHLDACPDCLHALRRLNDASVTSDLRAAGTLPDTNKSPRFQEMMSKLIAFGASGVKSGTVSSVASFGALTIEQSPAQNDSGELGFLAPAQAPDEIGRLSGYRVLKILGAGGMGLVLEAEDLRLKRRVALKVMKPEVAKKELNRQRFIREAEAAAKVEHDHIVPIFQIGEENGVPFIAMPFLKGEPLDARLKRGRIEMPEIVRIGRQIAQGLAAAHAQGLIHRDIKPGNVWLEEIRNTDGGIPNENRLSYRVRILDFGLARLSGDSENLTQSGTVLGTPAYMAPEQARGRAVDYRADLWSLGCILYEMSTGRRPFTGPDTMAILSALALDDPADPHSLNPNIPAGLARLIMRLLEKDPAKRPASADEVAEALRKLQLDRTDVVMSALFAEPASAEEKPRSRSSTRWIVAASLLLLSIGGGFTAYELIFKTKDGTLIVEVDGDADVRFQKGELQIFEAGKLKYTLKPSEKNKTLPPGSYMVEVAGPDGLKVDTPEFKLEKGGQAKVRVVVDPSKPILAKKESEPKPVDSATAGDPDRRAAEYVLSIGGVVRINDQFAPEIKSASNLPAEPFRLTMVHFFENKKVTDASLAVFKDCKNLTVLYVGGTQVSDDCLAHFKGCKNLTHLNLSATQISNAGLAELKDWKKLTFLHLGWTSVTNAGLIHLKECKNLEQLYLHETQVTDAGLAYFKDCNTLTAISLQSTMVGDEGLAYIKNCTSLFYIDLGGTEVSDAGLKILYDLRDLKEVDLTRSKVTAGGLAALKKALPKCKVLSDESVDRRAALYVIGVGGSICLNDQERFIKVGADLPGEPFRLTKCDLNENNLVSDTRLAEFKGCKYLTHLNLSNTPVTDIGLSHLKDCTKLIFLDLKKTKITRTKIDELKKGLPNCKIEWDGAVVDPKEAAADRQAAQWVLSIGGSILVNGQERQIKAIADLPKEAFQLTGVNLVGNKRFTDADLVQLKDCRNLVDLDLHATGLSDDGLVHFKECKNLQKLQLGMTRVTDEGLKYFKDCKNLWVLNLAETNISDKCLENFRNCKSLHWLDLSSTQITDAGLVNFRGKKNLRFLFLASTPISDAGLAHFKDSEYLFGAVDLHNTEVSDVGLKQLKYLTKLEVLNVKKTKMTAPGIEDLCKVLTQCKITWDKGTIEPK